MSAHPFKIFEAESIRQRARRAAQEIVPWLIEWLQPRSAVDVGCGTGTWLAVFREQGIVDTLGLDGEWVDLSALEIPPEQFVTGDLQRPILLDRSFDMVVSLEVAHYLAAESASRFVHTLTNLGSVVLFSAAIPGQWGAHHVHEQWPDQWAKCFQQHGFVAIDCLRKRFWDNPNVAWWYSQNAVLFVREECLQDCPKLKREFDKTKTLLRLVHPRHYEQHLWMYRILQAASTICEMVPVGKSLALVDDAQFGDNFVPRRHVLRLFEREDLYQGPPVDGAAAIAEVRRLAERGVEFLVVGWPSMWWLEYYREFAEYLSGKSQCIHSDENVTIFDLRNHTTSSGKGILH